jgi:hypothetical protein
MIGQSFHQYILQLNLLNCYLFLECAILTFIFEMYMRITSSKNKCHMICVNRIKNACNNHALYG